MCLPQNLTKMVCFWSEWAPDKKKTGNLTKIMQFWSNGILIKKNTTKSDKYILFGVKASIGAQGLQNAENLTCLPKADKIPRIQETDIRVSQTRKIKLTTAIHEILPVWANTSNSKRAANPAHPSKL